MNKTRKEYQTITESGFTSYPDVQKQKADDSARKTLKNDLYLDKKLRLKF